MSTDIPVTAPLSPESLRRCTRREAAALPATAPASPIPEEQLLDLLFGAALLEQGFSSEQAAAYLRRVQAARPTTSERMADRAEQHAAGVRAWRERAEAIAAQE